MEKFQEIVNDMQCSLLEIFNNMTVLLDSDSKSNEEKVKLLTEYVKEQSSILRKDIEIYENKELDEQPEKLLHLVQ